MMSAGDKTQVYKVRMTCGHIEDRRMRPATAGVPWSPEAIVHAGAECKACRAEADAFLAKLPLVRPFRVG
jgi:hypothetical protein